MVAEHHTAFADVLPSAAARFASAAREHGWNEHAVSGVPFLYAGTDFRNDARRLMPEHERRLCKCWNVVIDIVKIGVA
jgi:hypothetical protein